MILAERGWRGTWLRPLVPVHRAILWLQERLLARRTPRRLQGRVVSVGSLSAGGAGKTPVVMLVVEMLRSEGLRVDVLTRGYRRGGTGVERVDPAGSAMHFGDEPMLLSRRLGVPVWVGAERFDSGSAAEAESGDDALVHVLDDGFRHRRLHRDVDIVLLTRQDVEDLLIPAGNLREPLQALGRAHVIVLREEEESALRSFVPPGKALWVIRRQLRLPGKIPTTVVVFCGIARPDGFVAMLVEAGVTGIAEVRFRDHQTYGEREIVRLLAAASKARAKGFVTTEKDAVKLTADMLRRLEEIGPVVVAELRVELIDGSVRDLLNRL